MLTFSDNITVYVSTEIVDMRKSIAGLTMLVIEDFEMEPQSPCVFVFHNRARNKVKVLYWDQNGFALHIKQLMQGKFKFPSNTHADKYSITQNQLNWLLAGLDFHTMALFPEINFTDYF